MARPRKKPSDRWYNYERNHVTRYYSERYQATVYAMLGSSADRPGSGGHLRVQMAFIVPTLRHGKALSDKLHALMERELPKLTVEAMDETQSISNVQRAIDRKLNTGGKSARKRASKKSKARAESEREIDQPLPLQADRDGEREREPGLQVLREAAGGDLPEPITPDPWSSDEFGHE